MLWAILCKHFKCSPLGLVHLGKDIELPVTHCAVPELVTGNRLTLLQGPLPKQCPWFLQGGQPPPWAVEGCYTWVQHFKQQTTAWDSWHHGPWKEKPSWKDRSVPLLTATLNKATMMTPNNCLNSFSLGLLLVSTAQTSSWELQDGEVMGRPPCFPLLPWELQWQEGENLRAQKRKRRKYLMWSMRALPTLFIHHLRWVRMKKKIGI